MNAQSPLQRFDTGPPTRISVATIFGVVGGPAAWFVQLLAGYTLTSAACFARDQRLPSPAVHWTWTYGGIVWLSMLCLGIALAAFLSSWETLRTIERQSAVTDRRNHFVASWGCALGAGFFVATLLTGVGIAVLPRCAG